ncbi:NADH dehydrogenase subunit G [Actinoplanes sp. SE50]|uniref:NADH-quinone oxidoreductase subunit G n=1 Tax=unclassified Actinoplanes TaxID=2626549 RepID=UPI00023EC1DE|nr:MULTISPECIES: NADH-quinone oxidoreductase subunit G [unclassified Actinoplanes]AEV81348.1 NADH dehydrogenase I subunit G [Actinoplanes sp. SE50/110]ATO79751.1 NADH dehydrogenase subunit G [Actinoplanes sp. SE50]SLL97154.1 NADH dehydrogenase, subunit G [Actinoplanes sp. SE50/110]
MTDVAKRADTVKLTIDGVEVVAEKGELLIRVAERMGIAIPRFCDHPLLAPAGACRQCLVEVEGQRKPIASCTQTVADGMVVKTQLSSPVAAKAQAGVMELLLINHPLDCPTCDKGGECPLQNQAMSTGRADSRFHEHKREYEKPIHISSQVLLDRERCVLCQRCTRFSEEIAGDKFIDLMDRSSGEQINVYRDDFFGGAGTGDGQVGEGAGDVAFNSYFSGNTIQICPVGALTGEQYRFRARPFDLVSSPTACEHCAAGCSMRADHRRGKVLRRLAGDDPAVNEEWNCDKGRWGFRYATATDRITTPLIRDARTGQLREASWSEALVTAAEGLKAARERGVGVLTGGRLTVEDAYAYAKFARIVLGTNDIDFRARPVRASGSPAEITEEADFLAAAVAGVSDLSYADVEAAPSILIVGLEPEEECPILFLRLRKASRRQLRVTAVAPHLTRGFEKLGATLVAAVPGDEARLLNTDPTVAAALSAPGSLLLVGERLATVPGGLSAAAALAARTGARLAWVPRRAGDRGAVDAGCLPNLLPGGRPVGDTSSRAELSLSWSVDAGVLPSRPGRDVDAIIAAAADGTLGGLLVGAVDPGDLTDPALAERALDAVPFLVSLELRHSAVTARADVVLPVAPAVEKSGTYMDWEGRLRSFGTVLRGSTAMTDGRVLEAIAALLDVTLNTGDVQAVRRELGAMPAGQARPALPSVAAEAVADPGERSAVLATWHQLIDLGTLLDGDDVLAGTARPPVVRLGKELAEQLRVADGDLLTVRTDRGSVTLPAAIADLPRQVVWLPTNSPGSTVRRSLGVTAGAVVRLSAGLPGPILAEGVDR